MRNYLLIMFIMILTSNILGQNLVKNGSFTFPDDSISYASIDSVDAWLTDDPEDGATKRNIRNDGNAVAGLADKGAGMYQVIGAVPFMETRYSISLKGWCYYTWNKNYNQKVTVILASYSGSDPTTRVAIDSIEFYFHTSVDAWETKIGEITIPAGHEHAGENMVLEIDMFLHSAENLSFMYFDDIILHEITFTTEFQNGDFTLPDDSADYASIDSIVAWLTDDPEEGKTKRTIRDDGNAVAGLADKGASMYQVVGTVPSGEITYSISLKGWCYYTWNKNYQQKINIRLAAFLGNDPATRVAIDSVELFFDTSVNDWETKGGTITIPSGSEHAGKYMVLEIDMFLHNVKNLSFMYFDNITFQEKEIDFTTEFQNGDFELPDDAKVYNSIDSIPGWVTDDPVNGKTKRHVSEDNGLASLADRGASMYQVVGEVPTEGTTYEISLDGWCYYTLNKNYQQKVNIILAAFAGADPTTRVAIDSLELFFDTSVNGWETKGGTITIPPGSGHAGKHLVIEIAMFLHDVKNLSFMYFDNITFREKEIDFTTEFQNGDFELPDDGKVYNSIDSIPGWMTDDPVNGKTKRLLREGNGVASLADQGTSIYQVAGKVPEEETTYNISLDGWCYYSWNKNYEQKVNVILAAFAGADPTTRVIIDSLELFFDTSVNNWETKAGTITIPGGSEHAGKHLVFEIDLVLQNAAYSSFFYFDNISFEIKPEYPYFSGVFENGNFDLPKDGKDYRSIDSIPGWLTDKVETVNSEGGYTGRRVVEGNGVGYQWDGVGGIYQVIGKVPSSETRYNVSFDVTCYYSYWSDFISNMYVIFSSFIGPDPKTRIPLDSLKFEVSCKRDDWNKWVTKSGTFTLPAGSTKAGENLVVELEIYDSRKYGWNEAWTYLYYDNVEINSTATGIDIDKSGYEIKIIPSYDKIEVRSPKKITKVSVYDLLGRKIKSSDVNTFNPEIMIGDLDGIYLVRVEMTDHFILKKIYFHK